MSIPLPIDDELPRILDALEHSRNLVVVSPPGSGKTTRIPPALLRAGLAGDGEIVVLEPRRIAARMAARRVAAELGERPGQTAGYQVRFERQLSAGTRIRFVTEGVLARQLSGDKELRDGSIVIIDEAHERHLDGDLCLALTRRWQHDRRDLRVIAMSATIDPGPLCAYLECPVVRSEGRLHPVAIEHEDYPDDRDVGLKVASAVRRLVSDGLDGHVLVFLPGAAEIRRASRACESLAAERDLAIVPLYGDLPAAEQDRAVAPSERRKVILSTNVAESSITIDGVVAVIDSGSARVARYSPWSGMRTLRVEPISRASAAQRAGRAGRTGPGRCLRLYTRHDHDSRRESQSPEISRADLCGLMLSLEAAGIGHPDRLAWLDPPPAPAVNAGAEVLDWLGALGPGGITEIGRRMHRFGVHPRQARLLVAAEDLGVASEGATVAALLGERDLRDRREPNASVSGPSDVLEDLDRLEDARGGPARSIRRARKQLGRAARNRAPEPEDPLEIDDALMRALLAAYPDRVARRRSPGSRELVFAGGGAGVLAPTSVLASGDAELMVAVEAAERGRGGARKTIVHRASAVKLEWLLDDHIDHVRDVDKLHWDANRERVGRVARICYGELVLDEERRAADPEAAAGLLAARVRAAGVDAFVDRDRLERWRARLAFVAEHLPDLEIEVPGDDAMIERIVELARGCLGFAEIRAADPLSSLVYSFPEAVRRALERLAPEHVSLPGRRRVPVHYETDARPPWIESRLQDFFGLERGPALADGRAPLVLHLLAPNRRAVQVTSDLAGFWDRHYPAIRKQLMRRYPKHAWPEDPRRR